MEGTIMPIRRMRFPDRFAILPSDRYKFGEQKSVNSAFEIVARTRLPNGVEILVINAGLIALDFTNNPELGNITVVRFEGNGEVPQEAMESQTQILRVQGMRMRLATFVTACLLGSHAYATNSVVGDALFPGLHEVFAWLEPQPGIFRVPAEVAPVLAPRLLRSMAHLEYIPIKNINLGLNLASRLILARTSYYATDPVSLIVMTYQAMILHSRQHAGASVALQALVVESALEELMYACGFVEGIPPRVSTGRLVAAMSKKTVRNLKFKGRIDALAEAGVLDDYLVTRLEALRNVRNVLMHEGHDASPGQSGEGLTAVRDLLRCCTNEKAFELNMAWSYRF